MKSVREVAEEYRIKKIAFKSLNTQKCVRLFFKKYLYDQIGDMPIEKVDPARF